MNYYTPPEPGILSNPTILVGLLLLAILVVVVLVIYIWRYFLRKGYKLPPEFRRVILLVAVPKETGNLQAGTTQENTVQKNQEQIAWAENLLTALGGLQPASGFKTWLYGRQDEVALEIVAQHGMIYFYVVVPRYLQQYMEQQIQAQYPHAQIEEQDDYNIFIPHGYTSAAALTLLRPDVLPIKTFRRLENDPLNVLTNSLSKLNNQEGAVVQIIARPVGGQGHTRGRKLVALVMSGQDMKTAIKKVTRYTAWYDRTAHGLLKGIGQIRTVLSTDAGQSSHTPINNPQISALDQELLRSIEEKSAKAMLEINLRVVVSSNNSALSLANLNNVLNSFAQYNIYEYGNGFRAAKTKNIDTLVRDSIHRVFKSDLGYILNTEELASIFHFPLPNCETPNIHWLGAKKAAAPVNMPATGIILGKNLYRNKETMVRIKTDDRRRHMYIVGMTGTGKSTLMVNMAVQDIQQGEGVCFIDPHGTSLEEILPSIPPERLADVIYFDPADTALPIGLNMLEADTVEEKDFATQEMILIFYKLVTDPQMLGPMFEHYMRNAMLLLMADKDDPGTIVEIPRVFVDDKFRQAKLKKCPDILVRSFWEKEYVASQRGTTGADMLSYVISKVGRFIENEMMRNVIGQPHSGFDIREIMDQKKILLVNLSKGKIGEVNSNLLGLVLVSKLQMAALSRANLPEDQRHDFYLYIDEFQNYVTDSITTILAEARKYKLNLTMAHQYIGQLVKNTDTSVKDAVFGNVGTIVSYRIGVEDAEMMAKQFAPVFNEFDLINIEKFSAYIRLLIDNQVARPFNMATFPPMRGDLNVARAIVEHSRRKYGRPKSSVENEILRRSKLGEGVEVESRDRMDMR